MELLYVARLFAPYVLAILMFELGMRLGRSRGRLLGYAEGYADGIMADKEIRDKVLDVEVTEDDGVVRMEVTMDE